MRRTWAVGIGLSATAGLVAAMIVGTVSGQAADPGTARIADPAAVEQQAAQQLDAEATAHVHGDGDAGRVSGGSTDQAVAQGDTLDFAAAGPRFRVPFECGEVWLGGTRSDHSPANAIDFNHSPDEGWKVTASAAGKVKQARNLGNRSYGKFVEIEHPGGYSTIYAHLSSIMVSQEDQVKIGQVIGRVGNTGNSFGAHLHYEQKRGGSAVRATFYGNQPAHYWGKKNYTVNCDGGGDEQPPPPPPSDGAHRFPAKADLDGRQGPSKNSKTLKVNAYRKGGQVPVVCQIKGDEAYGSKIWDKTKDGYFVTDVYVKTGVDGFAPGVPRCDKAKEPKPEPKPEGDVHRFPAKADLDGRQGPSKNSKTLKVNAYRKGDQVPVVCQIKGDQAYGSKIWDKTKDGYFVTDVYVKTGVDGFATDVPRCDKAEEPKPDKGMAFPVKADLNGRDAPSLHAKTVKDDAYLQGTKVTVVCQTEGALAYGSKIWNKTAEGYYVTDSYVLTGTNGFVDGLPRCEGVPPIPDPPGTDKQVRGLDTSNYQAGKDMGAQAAKGRKFNLIKASEGSTYVDPAFGKLTKASRAAGMITGAYHFANPAGASGKAQAEWFIKHGGGWTADGKTLPGALDLEAGCYGKNHAQMIDWIADFAKTYKSKTGRDVMIYTTRGWWTDCTGNTKKFSANPLWMVALGSQSRDPYSGWSKATFIQTAFGELGGEDGMDQDIFLGSMKALKAFAANKPLEDDDPKPDKPSGVGEKVKRDEMISRARFWVDKNVPYSMTGWEPDQQGKNYRTDCSGFVSMAWHLKDSLNTVTLPNVAKRIDWEDLKPGDAVGTLGAGTAGAAGHVVLFLRWANDSHTSFITLEERGGGHGSIQYERSINYTVGGFTAKPYRYNKTKK